MMFNNALFSCEKLQRMKNSGQTRHESLQRLLRIALELARVDGPAALASALGESEQTVTNWGSRGVSKAGAMKAQAKFGCSANWVLHSTQPRIIGGAEGEEAGNVLSAQIGARRIPMIDYVQAGVWTEVLDGFQPGDAEDWLLTDLDLSGSAFALQIKGESMRPDFTPGDRVIIDPDVQPQAGDFVVAKNGEEEATFKKYRVRGTDSTGSAIFELVPLNPDFETMRSDERPIRIVGVMVEHRKYRRNR